MLQLLSMIWLLKIVNKVKEKAHYWALKVQ